MASETIGEMKIDLTASTLKFDKKLKDGEKQLRSFTEIARESILSNIVTKGFNVAVDAAKNFATSAISVGMKFEKSMSEVAAISGATGSELELLEKTAREFGASTQFSASESAEALKYMSLAGWDANQSVGALGGVLDLAAASGMELGRASDMVTDYLSAFGMQAEQSAYFADILSYAQSKSNTTAEQLGEAYKNCAANLNAAGQDVETTTSLLAMMANQGLKGSEAGTALNAVMRDMTAKMKNGAIAIGNTSVKVMDANGNYRDMTDILKDVEKATDGMGDAEKAAALSASFTSDSIKGLNLIMNSGVGEAEKFEEALRGSDGTAKDMAATMNDNLEGKLKSLNSKFEELQISLFNNLEPVLDVVIDALGWCADNADTLIPIIVSLGGAIAGVFVVDKINQFCSKAKSIFDTTTKVFGKFKDKTVDVAKGVSKSSSDIVSSTDKMAQGGESLTTRLSNSIKSVTDVITTALQSLGRILGSLVDAVMEPVKRLFTGLGEAIAGFFQALASPQLLMGVVVFTAAAAGIAAAIFLVGEAIGAITPGLAEFLNTVLIPLADFIASTLITVINDITDCIIRLTQDAIIPFGEFVRDTVIMIVETLTNNIIKLTQEALIPLFREVREFLEWLFSKIGEVFGFIWGVISNVVNNIKTAFQAVWNKITEVFTGIWNKAREIFTGIWSTISGVVDKIKNAFQGAWNFIVAVFSPIVNFFKNIFTGAFNAVKNVFSGIGSFFQGVWNTITGIFTSIGSTIGNAVSGAFKGVVNGIIGFAEGFINTPVRAINTLIDVINAIPGIELGHLSELHLPRMAQGGIVPGTSYSGDHNMIMANSGEMVLTRSQQASLWSMIERGDYGDESEDGGVPGGQPIEINNTYEINSNLDAEVVSDIILAEIRKAVA